MIEEYSTIDEIVTDIKALRCQLDDAMKILEHICESIPEELWESKDD